MSRKIVVAAVVAALSQIASAQGVGALNLGPSFTLASGAGSIAGGQFTLASGDFSLALGQQTSATDTSAIALGTNATASGSLSIAVGSATASTGASAVAVGQAASATGAAALAVGSHASASGVQALAAGTNAIAGGQSAVAVGPSANSDGQEAVAVGSIASAEAFGSTALGSFSSVGKAFVGSVALGSNSSASASNQVNVGGRTIGGLSAGATFDDAVTLLQMDSAIGAVQVLVDANTTQIANHAVRIAALENAAPAAPYDDTSVKVAIASNSASIASNTTAIVGNTANIAVNGKAIASNTTAIVSNTANIAVNGKAIASNTTAIASNTAAIADLDAWRNAPAVWVGNGAVAATAGAVAVGAGAFARDAHDTAIGAGARVESDFGTATGALAFVAAGSQGTALGAGARVESGAAGSVAVGTGSVATRAGVVEIGGRQISGVGDGVAAQDAANVGQVQAAQAAAQAYTDDAIANNMAAIGNLAADVAAVDGRVSRLSRRLDSAIASVGASPVLPSLSPGERGAGMAIGNYNGQTAVGVAIGYATSGGALLQANTTAGAGKPVMRLSAGWRF